MIIFLSSHRVHEVVHIFFHCIFTHGFESFGWHALFQLPSWARLRGRRPCTGDQHFASQLEPLNCTLFSGLFSFSEIQRRFGWRGSLHFSRCSFLGNHRENAIIGSPATAGENVAFFSLFATKWRCHDHLQGET